MISPEEKQKIAQEAKAILENFGKSLENVKVATKKGSMKSEVRTEYEGEQASNEMRKAILENAPRKNSDHIISEKANWN